MVNVFVVYFVSNSKKPKKPKNPDSERLSKLFTVTQPIDAESGSKFSSARSQGPLSFHEKQY